jgi:epoxide hydrolase-like predicted phosphatase
MTIKTLIWDIGGVLVRTEDRAPRTRLAQAYGLTYRQLEDLIFNSEDGQNGQIGQLSADEVWRRAASELGAAPERIPALQEAFFDGDVLDIELLDAIRAMHGQFKTGIITNAFDNARHLVTEVWQMADAFDHILVSAEFGVMKPHPSIYQESLRGLSVLPEEAVFIDDFAHNIESARKIGMNAILFSNRPQILREIREMVEDKDKS